MVMKRTRMQHLRKTILKNAVSFFTVAFIAAVSIAIYLGIQSGTDAILKDADAYFSENNLAVLEFTCANGITKADLEALRSRGDIDHAEGGYSVTVKASLAGETMNLRALSLTSSVNVPIVLEGRLPSKPDEVAIEEMLSQETGLCVGDRLTIRHDGSLLTDSFLVTAIINQPAYCCAISKDSRGVGTAGLGAADRYIAFAKEAFHAPYFGDSYTTVYANNDSVSKLFYYSEEYTEKETELKNSLLSFCEERAELRYEELLKTAAPAIEAGLMTAENITYQEWFCFGRSEMGDLLSVQGLVESVNGISYSLSIVFLLVAVVVCHAAISRMIDEQRILIGAQKAMGFSSSEIMKHYLLYNILCAGLGILLGWIVSFAAVEPIILLILSEDFLLGNIPMDFAWREALIAAGLCMGIFVITTYATCKKLTKLAATILLRGELPAQGKHYFFETYRVYQRMSLYFKTMIKNVLNDTGRIMTTVIGVVGCISLLVICLSLKFAIDGAFVKQYKEHFLYEQRLEIDTKEGSAEDFETVLQEENRSYLKIQDKLRAFRIDNGNFMNGHLISLPEEETISNFMVLKEYKTGKLLSVPKDGILISRKCAEVYGLSEGDTVEMMDSSGQLKPLLVVGVIEHYLQYHLFVTSDSYYEKAMGEKADRSVLLIKENKENLDLRLQVLPGFMSFRDNSDQAENTDAIYMAIAVCLALSVAMALLVLLNQITMHINRKAKELAVMRINGYSLKETKAYIYKDNIILTVLGLILGSIVGAGLSYIVILIMEREPSSYIHTPNPIAYLIACSVGAAFALIVNLIALRKIDTLNLTNVNSN